VETTAGIAEMLIGNLTKEGIIFYCLHLPKGRDSGRLKGIKAKQEFELEMWNGKISKLTSAKQLIAHMR